MVSFMIDARRQFFRCGESEHTFGIGNKVSIGKEILQLFDTNARRVVANAVSNVVLGAAGGSKNLGAISSEYLALLAALLTHLHVQTGGGGTGACFLENAAGALQTARNSSTQNVKAATNLTQLFGYFYLVDLVGALGFVLPASDLQL